MRTQVKLIAFVQLLTIFLSGLCFAAEENQSSTSKPVVAIETNKGTIHVELYQQKAPASVANFVAYMESGFYDGLVFHRVIPGFMIQGGGFDSQLERKSTRAPISNEANPFLPNKRGTVAMARTSDPHSATSQFFINVADNHFLNKTNAKPGYAVFGRVIKGMGVVDTIANVPTTLKGGMKDVPTSAVVIRSVTALKHDE